MPRVSILLPIFDAAPTLPAALASLRAQTYSDFEIVAVDDGSRDDSLAVLESCPEPRLRLVRRPHAGLVAALNAGLAACTGTLVARMDADDVAHPDRLAAQVAFLDARPDVGVASCLVEGVDAGPGMSRYIAWLNTVREPSEIAHARFIESPIAHPSVLARRELLDYRDQGWPEDYELWLRLLAAGVRFAKVPRVLLGWRDHPSRATRTRPEYASERHRALKLHYLLAGPLASPAPIVFWGAGTEGKPMLCALRTLGVSVPWVIDVDARKIGNVVHGARVVHERELGAILASLPGARVLVAVGVPSARPGIRAALSRQGLVEGESFWFLC